MERIVANELAFESSWLQLVSPLWLESSLLVHISGAAEGPEMLDIRLLIQNVKELIESLVGAHRASVPRGREQVDNYYSCSNSVQPEVRGDASGVAYRAGRFYNGSVASFRRSVLGLCIGCSEKELYATGCELCLYNLVFELRS